MTTGRYGDLMFEPGSTVVLHEVLHGRDWLTHPETVVADDGHELVTLLRPGTPFTFHDHPHGPHPWAAEHTSWEGPALLRATRAGDRYGAWRFYDRVGEVWQPRFLYLNFQAPMVRRADGYATDDHGLDLIVHPDGRREWKDVEDLHGQLAEGRIDEQTVLAVLAETTLVLAELDGGDPWWSRWDDWLPDA
jgi:hypothetical protein